MVFRVEMVLGSQETVEQTGGCFRATESKLSGHLIYVLVSTDGTVEWLHQGAQAPQNPGACSSS